MLQLDSFASAARLIISKPLQAFLAETVDTGNKIRCVTETTHVLRRRRKLRFRAFPERVCPRILSLESVDYFGTSEHFGGRKTKKRRIIISKRLTGLVYFGLLVCLP